MNKQHKNCYCNFIIIVITIIQTTVIIILIASAYLAFSHHQTVGFCNHLVSSSGKLLSTIIISALQMRKLKLGWLNELTKVT